MFKVCMLTIGVGVIVITLLGCSHQAWTSRQCPIFAAWEDGLTLSFEHKEQSSRGLATKGQHFVQVNKSTQTPFGLLVMKTFCSPGERKKLKMVCRNGGVLIQNQEHDALAQKVLLPEFFPNKVSRWQSNGLLNRIIGRTIISLAGIKTEGIWVESIAVDDVSCRTRTLYVHDIGECQTMVWDTATKCWLPTMKLSNKTFTDTDI